MLPLCALLTLAACARNVRPAPPLPPRVTPEQAVKLVPPDVKEREGWAEDVLAALAGKRDGLLEEMAQRRIDETR